MVDPFTPSTIGVSIDSGEFTVRARPHSSQEALDCARLHSEMSGTEFLTAALVPLLAANVVAVDGLNTRTDADYPASEDDRAIWWLSEVTPEVAFNTELCIRIGRKPAEGAISESGTAGKSPESED